MLTAIYLSTFAPWLDDVSPNFEGTRRVLDRLLSLAARATMGGVPPR